MDYFMAFSCGASLILILLTVVNESIPKRMKMQLIGLAFASAILQIANKVTRLYDGNVTITGLILARSCKLIAYFLFLVIIYIFNSYVKDMFMKDKNECKVPCVLQVVDIILLVGTLVLVISQFTGLYYHYDNTNTYVRSPYNALAYVIPVLALLLQLAEIIMHYNHFARRMVIPLVLFIVMPIMASVSQLIFHTVSLTGLTVVAMTAVLYSFSVFDINEELKAAHRKELDMLRSREELSKKLLAETASALAEAIDAKDSYTNGHSNRVAEYSRMIAQVAGKSQQLCDEIYLIALLHDVGKIGIPNVIINKNDKLTDEEYDIIKTHPVKGNEILKKISSSPSLAIGAHYHHERYDGKGYPEGLRGEEIPEIARIIACADAYDAMASKRSYRDVLPRDVIRAEFEKNLGTQFDPKFGQIMLHLIDCDTNYQMREK